MEVQTRLESLTSKRDRRFGLTSRQLNAVIELLFVTLIATGLLSWIFSLNLASLATTIHSIAGFMLLALVPLKIRGPVRTGFRRKRISRWLSAVFGIMVLAVLIIGVLHANAIWRGYGYWTGMWTHLLVGFSSIPLFLWHVVSRPSKSSLPKKVDADRRAFLTTSALLAAGTGAWGAQEIVQKAVGASAHDRAGTGSHEIASFDPDKMPRMIWINDKRPKIDFETWDLRVEGQPVALDDLWAMSKPIAAWLDCTDGWRSQQNWDVVPLADVLSGEDSRSVKVSSATGYNRLSSRSSAADVYLSVGYDGRHLHRPEWLQLPLPGPTL